MKNNKCIRCSKKVKQTQGKNSESNSNKSYNNIKIRRLGQVTTDFYKESKLNKSHVRKRLKKAWIRIKSIKEMFKNRQKS